MDSDGSNVTMGKSGQTVVAAALALEYGFRDVDGKQPRHPTVDEA
jgi:hypothetical protein